MMSGDLGSDAGASLPRSTPRGTPAGSRQRGVGGAAVRGGEQEAVLLALRDECDRAKRHEQAMEDKLRHLAAQLARTEEAAKRILTRTDPTARGGTAQRLLEAERDLAGAQAELAELRSQLARAKRQAADRKAHSAELKTQLDAALAAQRHLALQLGRLQAGGGSLGARGYMCSTPASIPGKLRTPSGRANEVGTEPAAGAAELVGGGAEAAVDAEVSAARRFALQQEQLAAAREQHDRLNAQLHQQQQVVQAQAGELAVLRDQLARRDGNAGPAGGALQQPAGACSGPAAAAAAAAGTTGGRFMRRTSSAGSEGSGSSWEDMAWLRLKYLESRSALERCTASNTQLLRELEGARGQILVLRQELRCQQQREQHRDQVLSEEEHEQEQQDWQQHGAGGVAWWQRGMSMDGCETSSRELPAPPPGAVPAAAVLQLRQQLAAANHRAARLQIEIDAAEAKLAVFQQHSNSSRNSDTLQQVMPRPLQPRQAAQDPRVLRDHPSHNSCSEKQQSEMRTGLPIAHGPEQSTLSPLPQAPMQEDVIGPALVHLHLHAAELDKNSLLRHSALSKVSTFLTAEMPGFATATTPVAEGRAPVYNATLQFMLDSNTSLTDLAAARARVELHCCTASSGGVAGYGTLASAWIPLAPLLGSGAYSCPSSQEEQCTLFDQNGNALGSLCFGMSVLQSGSACS